tara:strand:- start:25638 stop:25835 length:198 start_codon:yes stop_codon:yes gene_type:complete
MELNESDIFGGEQWSKDEQFAWELDSLKGELEYTITSSKRLSWKQIKELRKEITPFFESLKEKYK